MCRERKQRKCLIRRVGSLQTLTQFPWPVNRGLAFREILHHLFAASHLGRTRKVIHIGSGFPKRISRPAIASPPVTSLGWICRLVSFHLARKNWPWHRTLQYFAASKAFATAKFVQPVYSQNTATLQPPLFAPEISLLTASPPPANVAL